MVSLFKERLICKENRSCRKQEMLETDKGGYERFMSFKRK